MVDFLKVINSTTLATLINVTEATMTANFTQLINTTSWSNLQPQSLHERAEQILLQPETILVLVLSFFALVANILSLCATINIPHGLTTHSRLILSLGISDIFVTLSVFIHILNKVLNPAKIPPLFTAQERLLSSCMFAIITSLNTTAHLISLLNLFAMAMDHYIAILKPLYYNILLNKTRGNIIIIFLWLFAFIGGFANFLTGFNAANEDDMFNYCELMMYNEFHGEYVVICVTFVCLVSITFIYVRIYFEVKSTNCRVGILKKDNQHNKKALITTLIIIGTFIICWLPTCVFQIAMVIQVYVDKEMVEKFYSILLKANKYLYALLLMNSLCDPFIYAVRLRDVQMGYFKLLSKCCNFNFYENKLKEETQVTSISRRSTHQRESIVHRSEDEVEMLCTTSSSGIEVVSMQLATSSLIENNNKVESSCYSEENRNGL